MNTAAMHIARAVGAGNRAMETAGKICPEIGERNKTFFSDMGLMPKIVAIGNYIGTFMYDVYDDEINAAVASGYDSASGIQGR